MICDTQAYQVYILTTEFLKIFYNCATHICVHYIYNYIILHIIFCHGKCIVTIKYNTEIQLNFIFK